MFVLCFSRQEVASYLPVESPNDPNVLGISDPL